LLRIDRVALVPELRASRRNRSSNAAIQARTGRTERFG
jgi:hypothetical protein